MNNNTPFQQDLIKPHTSFTRSGHDLLLEELTFVDYPQDPLVQLSDNALQVRDALLTSLLEDFIIKYPTLSQSPAEKADRNVQMFLRRYTSNPVLSFRKIGAEFSNLAAARVDSIISSVHRKFRFEYAKDLRMFRKYEDTDLKYLAWGTTCDYDLLKLFEGEITWNENGWLELGTFITSKTEADLDLPQHFNRTFPLEHLFTGATKVKSPLRDDIPSRVPYYVEALQKFLIEFQQYKQALLEG